MFLLDMAGIRPSAMEPRTRWGACGVVTTSLSRDWKPTCGRDGSACALCASDGLRARTLDHTPISRDCDSPRTKMKCLYVK